MEKQEERKKFLDKNSVRNNNKFEFKYLIFSIFTLLTFVFLFTYRIDLYVNVSQDRKEFVRSIYLFQFLFTGAYSILGVFLISCLVIAISLNLVEVFSSKYRKLTSIKTTGFVASVISFILIGASLMLFELIYCKDVVNSYPLPETYLMISFPTNYIFGLSFILDFAFCLFGFIFKFDTFNRKEKEIIPLEIPEDTLTKKDLDEVEFIDFKNVDNNEQEK